MDDETVPSPTAIIPLIDGYWGMQDSGDHPWSRTGDGRVEIHFSDPLPPASLPEGDTR